MKRLLVLAIRHSTPNTGRELDRTLTEEGKRLVSVAREHARSMGFENPAATCATMAQCTQETARVFAPYVEPIIVPGAFLRVEDGPTWREVARIERDIQIASARDDSSSVSFAQQMTSPNAAAVYEYHRLLRARLHALLLKVQDRSHVLCVGHGSTMMTALQRFTRSSAPENLECGHCEGLLIRLRITRNSMMAIDLPRMFWPET